MGQLFLKTVCLASASLFILLTFGLAQVFAQIPLDPTTIPKYVTPLVIPPAMPLTGTVEGGAIDYYEIAVQQFQQQVLPSSLPQTTVWSYGSVNHPGSFHYPAFTIEAEVDRPVRVKWINNLKNEDGTFLPHLFPAAVDQTFHWANPPQDCAEGDPRPDCEGQSEDPYTGPVPIVTHLHGSHVTPESDGFPEAWYLPAANDIPAGYATQGSDFDQIAGAPVEAGAALYQYRNDQRATTLWYHDHTLGITRLNVYAGPAGFYLLRGGPTDLPAGTLPAAPYEIPIVIQDRAFLDDGSLNYLDGDGDTMVVNGKTWPFLNVEPRRYRVRFLNGANMNDQTLLLATDDTPGDSNIDDGDVTELTGPFVQVGADGGFLPAPVTLSELLIAPAERADVIVDFSGFPVGTVIYLINTDGLDATTGQVMKFIVVPLSSEDTSTPPEQLVLPARTPLGQADNVRQVSLNDGALLGTVDAGTGVPLRWADAITENPQLNATEIWEIHNFSGDAHPIHLHLVQFEILDRTPLGDTIGGPTTTPAEPWETGTKDTVIAYSDQITRVKAKFDLPGPFVWHCHILEHEDDEMMRPYEVVGTAQADQIGTFVAGSWFLDSNGNGVFEEGVDLQLLYGDPADLPLMGDWDGDGIRTPGVKRGNTYYLRNSNTSGVADLSFVYGDPGDMPVVGDWDSDGTDTIGIKRGNTYYLRNSNTSGVADISFDYGDASDMPIAGDWDGDGTDTIGIKRGNTYYLRNSNTSGVADISFIYGDASDTPIAGDWDGDGVDTIGVYRSAEGVFYLRNLNSSGTADVVNNFGVANGIPLVGL